MRQNYFDEIKLACEEHQLGKDGRPVAIIGRSMVIHGSATASEDADVLILGEVHGPVRSQGAVVIAKGAKVLGGVTAQRLCVLGELDAAADEAAAGEVSVEGLLDVRDQGLVCAEIINYGHLCIQAGARISGKINFLAFSAHVVQDCADVRPPPAMSVHERPSDAPAMDRPAAAPAIAQARESAGEPEAVTRDRGTQDRGEQPLEQAPEWHGPNPAIDAIAQTDQVRENGENVQSEAAVGHLDFLEPPAFLRQEASSRSATLHHLPKIDGTFGGAPSQRGG